MGTVDRLGQHIARAQSDGGNRVLEAGMAADEEDLGAFFVLEQPESFGELHSVQLGHPEVAHDDIGGHAARHQLQGGPAVGRGPALETGLGEALLKLLERVGVVVHDHDVDRCFIPDGIPGRVHMALSRRLAGYFQNGCVGQPAPGSSVPVLQYILQGRMHETLRCERINPCEQETAQRQAAAAWPPP